VKTGENNKLFGAITSKDVAELIKSQYKVYTKDFIRGK